MLLKKMKPMVRIYDIKVKNMKLQINLENATQY